MAKDRVLWPMIGFDDQGLGLGGRGSVLVVKDCVFGGQELGLLANNWVCWPRNWVLVAKDWVWWPRNGCLVAKDRVLWPRIGFDDQGLGLGGRGSVLVVKDCVFGGQELGLLAKDWVLVANDWIWWPGFGLVARLGFVAMDWV